MSPIQYKGWNIIETPCFPCKWKCIKIGAKDDNGTWRYKKSIKEAKQLIDKYSA